MKPHLIVGTNDQDYLADKFRISENHISSASKIALLKIQSWKFATKTPEIGAEYLLSIEDIIQKSFFAFVPPSHILSEESYFFSPHDN